MTLRRYIAQDMGIAWLYAGYPGLVKHGFAEKFEELSRLYPPSSSDVSKWTGAELVKMIGVLGLSKLEPALREQVAGRDATVTVLRVFGCLQEFLPENPEEESPFGSLDASELDEVFEDSGVPRIEIDALKVALRYLKGEFTNVSVKA